MDPLNANATRSRTPRSRLPVPAAPPNVRSSPSRDSLIASDSTTLPRLRGTPSRDQLSSTNKRGSSIGPVGYSPLKAQAQAQHESKSQNAVRRPPDRSISEQQGHASSMADRRTPKKHHQPASPAGTVEDESKQRKPRQSLSERTMETLSQLPPSPAVRKSNSSFFNSGSPMRPPSGHANSSRPGSSSQRDEPMPPPSRSISSRPGSSAGFKGEAVPIDFRASTSIINPPKQPLVTESKLKSPTNTKLPKTPLKAKSNVNLRSNVAPAKLLLPGPSAIMNDKLPTPTKNIQRTPNIKSGSKTISSRSLKPRASIGGLFRKPSMPELDRGGAGPNGKPIPINLRDTSVEAAPMISKSPLQSGSGTGIATEQLSTPRKSSLALREQIAKAKAAKRAQSSRQASGTQGVGAMEESSIIPAGTFDFGLADDPFNQHKGQDASKGLLRKRIDSARTDGRLNIAAMGLKEIPAEVMDMYNFDAINGDGSSWAESVDLTRFVAADNEFEILGDHIFPDVDPHELLDDDDSKGNQFGGLETLDLHGNLLSALPLGLRRLSLLTTLNLSYNKLDNHSFEVISQINSLRDLKIASNNLTGELNPRITNLQGLEALDVQHNHLASLPDGLTDLVRLRVLNVSENAFKALPFETLHQLPLIELSAAKNKLEGVLIDMQDIELPQLQVLDVTGNSLTSLASGELRLPALHQLSCAANRLTSLPSMASWQSLLTLAAEDNNISSIPEGFTSLAKVKNVDLTGNNLKTLDDKIGRMESLDIFRVSGNPLREKKFSSMTVEDLKRALSARLAPLETEIVQEELPEVFTSCPSSPTRPSSSDWSIKAGGVLDRSNTRSSNLNPDIAAETAANNTIRTLDLRHNLFKEIPSPVTLFASTLSTLILSHNELAADTFLHEDLDLPSLKELNLSSNTLSSLTPLAHHLTAPSLEKLDISFNRLTSLPTLRTSYPNLTILLAANNAITALPPSTVKGLKVLDCSSNDLESLNPRLGLLGGPGGLERLDVSGNRFRVPKYTVLEKGTEATLAWLRDRIPAAEMEMQVDEVVVETGIDDVD